MYKLTNDRNIESIQTLSFQPIKVSGYFFKVLKWDSDNHISAFGGSSALV
jgi:hypothetical protein